MNNMKYGMIGKLAMLGSIGLLSACGSTQRANPCVAWAAYNGPYLAKYTAKDPGSACAVNQGFTGAFAYDTIGAEIYDLGATTQLAMIPGITIAAADVNPDGSRADGVTIASANFDTKEVGADDTCTVATMEKATNHDGTVAVEYSNLVFQEDSNVQGTLFKGDAKITMFGCTTDYTFVAIAPPAGCETDDDCLPVADPAAGRPFSSGIASALHTYCNDEPAPLFGSAFCFPADEFPSMCPEGTIEGPAGSACPVGK